MYFFNASFDKKKEKKYFFEDDINIKIQNKNKHVINQNINIKSDDFFAVAVIYPSKQNKLLLLLTDFTK